MSKRILCAVALAGLLVGLVGCGKVPTTRYYAIDTRLPVAPATRTMPLDVAVARFRASQMLAQDRLVYRKGTHEVNYYNYDRWSVPPADMLADALIRGLKDSGMFRSVSTMQGGPKVDYLLRGYIELLEEVDGADGVTARVALRLDAVDMKTNAVVWSGRGAADRPVSDRSVTGVVRELNEGIQDSLQQVVRGMAGHFQR
jgi:ABC-type uncharacterized transport system auxiliary subunit